MTPDIKELVKRLREVETRERILGFGGSETLLLFSKEAAAALEAMAAERDRLKVALKLWQSAWATGRNEPMEIAANATKIALGGDT